MSLAKKILIGFVSLIVLLVLAVGILIATVDPNDHRQEITQFISDKTGRELSIGDMQISLFPHLGLRLENAKMSNAKGFEATDFATVDKVNVGVAILPLLKGELEIDALTLHGLNLNLERNAQGITNWDDLVNKTGEKTEHHKEEKHHQNESFEELAALSFGGLDIQDSHIQWNDQLNQQTVSLTPFDLSSDAVTFGEFFNVVLQADTRITNPNIQTHTDLSVDIKIEQDGQIEIQNLVQRNELKGENIPVAKLSTELDIPSLKLALGQTQIDLPELVLTYAVEGGKDFVAKELQGKLTLTQLKTDVQKQTTGAQTVKLTYDMQGADDFALSHATGEINLENPEFNLANQSLKSGRFTLDGELKGDTLPNGQANVSLSIQPELNMQAQTAALKDIQLQALDLKASGQVQLSQLKTHPKASSQLALNETNLRRLLAQLGLKIDAVERMSDKTTLTRASAKLAVDFDSQSQAVKVKNLSVKLDDSELKGQASFQNFEKPDIGFNLALDQIDLNRYLPPKPKQAPEPTPETETADTPITLPTELLRNLKINGTFKAGKVTYDKLNPQNIVATVKGQDGLINLNPLKMDIFKTQILASASLDVRGKLPKYAFKTDTKNVPVGDVLLAFTDNDRLSGTGSVNANITTAGDRLSAFKQNLNGTAAVNLKDGAIKGFNLAQSIRQAKAKIAGEKAAGPTEELKTDFSSLISEVQITNGVVDTKKLLAQAPYMRINGLGKVNLVKEELDYLVKTKIVASDKGQGGEDLKELNGLTIPVKLKGALKSPKVSLDLESLLEQKAKQEVEKKIEEKKEEVQKKIEDELKSNILKGFKF